MTREEILLKVTADVQQATVDLKKIQQEMDKTGGHVEKSAHGTREFRKLLHELSAQAPLLGAAMKMAFSVTGGAMMAAVAIFETVKGKIEGINEQLSKMLEMNQRPMGNMKQNLREAAKSADEARKSFAEWMQGHVDNKNPAIKALEREIVLLDERHKLIQQNIDRQVAMGKQNEEWGRVKTWENQISQAKDTKAAAEKARDALKLQRDESEKVVRTAEGKVEQIIPQAKLLNKGETRAQIEERIKELGKTRDEIEPAVERVSKAGGAKWYEFWKMLDPGLWKDRFGGANGAGWADKERYNDLNKQIQQARDSLKRFDKSVIESTEAQTDKQVDLDKAKRDYDRIHEAWKVANEKAIEANNNIEKLGMEKPGASAYKQAGRYRNDVDMPNMEQIINSGMWVRGQRTAWNWMFQRGPFARVAQEFELRGEQATQARAMGNVGLYNQLEDRKNYLGGILRNAGLMPQDKSLAMDEKLGSMVSILTAVTSGSASIKVEGKD